MKEVYITEEELEYYSNPVSTDTVNETDSTTYNMPQLSFEEEAKDCITIEEFREMWHESIRRLIPNP